MKYMVEIRSITITTPLAHSFNCNNCGLCCEGPVELSEGDYERLRRIRPDIDRYIEVRRRNGKIRRILRPVEKSDLLQECIFLKHENNRRLCSIYDDRPSYCRLYPIFVAYSRNMRKFYVDILHCPGVRHDGSNIIDSELILSTLDAILKRDETFIEVVPNVDRAVIFSLYHRFRDVYLDWKLKYSIMIELNNVLLQRIRHCENSLQLLIEIYRFQNMMKENIRSIDNIFNIVNNVQRSSEAKFSFSDFMKTLSNLLIVKALSRAGSLIVVDNYSKRVYSARLSIDFFRNMIIENTDLDIICELFYRLSTNIQTCALPIEYAYTQGYLNIVLLYFIYRGLCENYEACLYNLDAVGLSLYSRELIKYMRDLGISYIELLDKS
ncbi:MAG: YkgJ family cysteine cluster protein [Crenarchaeota archaeon]|nr:YkgJ family cysteine cluster protein [Thermoproteota archaeon]